jgi:hypothetical protein
MQERRPRGSGRAVSKRPYADAFQLCAATLYREQGRQYERNRNDGRHRAPSTRFKPFITLAFR